MHLLIQQKKGSQSMREKACSKASFLEGGTAFSRASCSGPNSKRHMDRKNGKIAGLPMRNEHPARVMVKVRPNRLLSMAPGILARAPEVGNL